MNSSSVLKMSIKEIAEDYEQKWVKDEFLYIEDAIEAAIIKFIELRGVAEATDLKALADQLEADLTVYWSTKYREKIIAQLRAKLEEISALATPEGEPESYKEKYLNLSDQHAKLCDQVYQEDGETLKPFAKGDPT